MMCYNEYEAEHQGIVNLLKYVSKSLKYETKREKSMKKKSSFVIIIISSMILVMLLSACSNTSKVKEALIGTWRYEKEFSYYEIYSKYSDTATTYYEYTFDQHDNVFHFKLYTIPTDVGGEKDEWYGTYEIKGGKIYCYNEHGATKMTMEYKFEDGVLQLSRTDVSQQLKK